MAGSPAWPSWPPPPAWPDRRPRTRRSRPASTAAASDLEPLDRPADLAACERVGRAVPGDHREPSASIGAPGELTDGGDGIVNVPISCPPVRGGCRGTLTLVSAQALKVGASGIPMRVTLGSAPFLLGPGSR